MTMKLIPLLHDSKLPLPGEDWHKRISEDPAVWEQWRRNRLNYGMPVEENGRVVIDFDDKAAGQEFVQEHPEVCTVMVETRRGIHIHCSGKTDARKFEHGDIKGNGYVVYPPSVVDGFQYRFVANGELKPFPEHLFPRKESHVQRREVVRRIANYLSRVESIQGQNGSSGMVRAVAICRDSGLSESEATIELLKWNSGPTVSPPWSDKELCRAITRIYARSKK